MVAKKMPAVSSAEAVYSKEKLLTMQRYVLRQDLLSALLEDGERYTIVQADGLIDAFMKGKVK